MAYCSLSVIDRSREKSVKGFRAKSHHFSNPPSRQFLSWGGAQWPTRVSTLRKRTGDRDGPTDAIKSGGHFGPEAPSIAAFFILPCARFLLLPSKSSSLRSLTIQNERSTASATLYAG